MRLLLKVRRELFVAVAVALPALLFAADEAVVARVNKAEITKRQLEDAIDGIIPRATFHGKIPDERREEYREQALESLITAELQYQDAVARKVKVDRSAVKEELKRIRGSFRSSSEYRTWLERGRLSEDALQGLVERQLTIRNAVSEIIEQPSQLEDRDVRRYYDEHPDKFQEPESVKLRVLSVKDSRSAGEVLARLKAGEDFGAVASAYSEDKYRVRGGDIGFVRRGMIIPVLEEAAFSLKQGEISSGIRTDAGIFILKVEERKAARTVPFEEARNPLKNELETQKKNQMLDQWVSGLRSRAVIEIISNTSQRTDAGN